MHAITFQGLWWCLYLCLKSKGLIRVLLASDVGVRLEDKGMATTWSALRVGWAAGGDGQSEVRVDLRNAAAFVRDPAAIISCLLLPLYASLRMEMQACVLLRASQEGEVVHSSHLLFSGLFSGLWLTMHCQ